MACRYGSQDGIYRARQPWENGYWEFNSKLRGEFLNGEIFYLLKEIRVLAERWRVLYNNVRPHPPLRLSINKNSRATLTMKLVQKIGQTRLRQAGQFMHVPGLKADRSGLWCNCLLQCLQQV
jgi:hypothetical protein